MSVLMLKSVLTTVALALAAAQALTMAQVRGYVRILPGSRQRLRRAHRWCGDSTLVLAVVVAGLCLTTQSYAPYPAYVPIHAALGTVAILTLALKIALARRFRSQLRYALALGSLAGLLILGVFITSALRYFISYA